MVFVSHLLLPILLNPPFPKKRKITKTPLQSAEVLIGVISVILMLTERLEMRRAKDLVEAGVAFWVCVLDGEHGRGEPLAHGVRAVGGVRQGGTGGNG